MRALQGGEERRRVLAERDVLDEGGSGSWMAVVVAWIRLVP